MILSKQEKKIHKIFDKMDSALDDLAEGLEELESLLTEEDE